MHSHSSALSPLLMAREMSNKTPALSWTLLGCGWEGRDLSASHCPTSFAGQLQWWEHSLGHSLEITDNLAAGTRVLVGRSHAWVPGLSYQELPELLAPIICYNSLDHAFGDSPWMYV